VNAKLNGMGEFDYLVDAGEKTFNEPLEMWSFQDLNTGIRWN
jgi:hypothetical protein